MVKVRLGPDYLGLVPTSDFDGCLPAPRAYPLDGPTGPTVVSVDEGPTPSPASTPNPGSLLQPP